MVKVPTDMARPRIRVGKISEITIQGSGPSEKAKQAMNIRIGASTSQPLVTWK